MSSLLDDRPTFPLANLLELPGGRVAEWEAIGTGEPLLWIEGGPGLPAHLARPDVALLADRFRAHLVNAPGCGRSSPPSDYSLETHVQYFEDVRRALRLGPVTVMGHSWGGLVALAFALAHPESVTRIVTIDGYAGEASVPEAAAGAERDRALDRLRDRPWLEHALASFADTGRTPREADDRFKACWPLYFAEPEAERSRSHIARLQEETRWNLDAVEAWAPEPSIDLLPELVAIHCPTLVFAGEHDFICGPAWGRPIAAAIPGAVYAEIPGVGHLPQYEAPDEFRRTVIDWLDAERSRISPSPGRPPGSSGSDR